MRGGVTDAGRQRRQTKSEDRATQPIEAGGWVSQFEMCIIWNESIRIFAKITSGYKVQGFTLCLWQVSL